MDSMDSNEREQFYKEWQRDFIHIEAMNAVTKGKIFIEAVRSGASVRDARYKCYKANWLDMFYDGPKPISNFEKKISKAKSKLDFSLSLASVYEEVSVEYTTMDSIYEIWAARYAAKLYAKGQSETFSYYLLCGLTVSSINRLITFCECCQWRIKGAVNYRYCIACSTDSRRNKGSRVALNRKQRSIHNLLKDSIEYQNYEKVRNIRDDYWLRLAAGLAPLSAEVGNIDKFDFTSDPEYIAAKEALAKLWAKSEPVSRAQRTATSEQAMMNLAKQGHIKAEVARQLMKSKAAVSKACKRNEELAAAFIKYSET